MKQLCVFAVLVSLSAFSSLAVIGEEQLPQNSQLTPDPFSQDSYHGIPFGSLSEPNSDRVADVFGEDQSNINRRCVFDGEKYVIVSISGSNSQNRISLRSIELRTTPPKTECLKAQSVLPGFGELKPGMFSFEIIARLKAAGFVKQDSSYKTAIYAKDILQQAQCFHQQADNYNPELFYYGAQGYTVSYSLTEVKKSVVGSISTAVRDKFVEEPNAECEQGILR